MSSHLDNQPISPETEVALAAANEGSVILDEAQRELPSTPHLAEGLGTLSVTQASLPEVESPVEKPGSVVKLESDNPDNPLEEYKIGEHSLMLHRNTKKCDLDGTFFGLTEDQFSILKILLDKPDKTLKQTDFRSLGFPERNTVSATRSALSSAVNALMTKVNDITPLIFKFGESGGAKYALTINPDTIAAAPRDFMLDPPVSSKRTATKVNPRSPLPAVEFKSTPAPTPKNPTPKPPPNPKFSFPPPRRYRNSTRGSYAWR